MLVGNLRRISDPPANNVNRELLHEFCLTGRPEVLKQLWPWRQTRTFDYPVQLGPKVNTRITTPSDNILAPRFCRFKTLCKVRGQFGEDRNFSDTPIGMVFGLGSVDGKPVACPVNVRPLQT